MSASIDCPSCGSELALGDQSPKRVRCPRCKEVFTVGAKTPSPKRRRSSTTLPDRNKKTAVGRKRKARKSGIPIVPLAIGGAVVVLLGVVVFLVTSLGGDSADTNTSSATAGSNSSGSDTAGSSATAALASAELVSEADALEFAKTLEKAAKDGDTATFTQLLNYGGLIDRAIEDIDVPTQMKKGFRSGVMQGQSQFVQAIFGGIQADGSYRFLNQRSSDGKRQVLFRLITGGGVNYHLFDLVKRNGRTMSGDLFVGMSGEYLSSTLRRLFLPLAQNANRSLLDRLLGKEQLFVKHWPKIEVLTKAFQAGQYQAAMQQFRRLPKELQNEKFIQLLRIQCSSNLPNTSEYSQALSAFRQAHPGSVAADLMSIDFYILRKQYSESLQAIDRVDKFAQRDPYLQILRGNVYLVAEDFDKASDCYEPLLKDERLGQAATTSFLDVVIAKKDHQRTLEILLRLENEYGLAFPRDLSRLEGFEAFGRSPEHKQFMDR